ncbi:(Fe-S)-binding protein [Priestia endophytica]|uniref:(Fe-S)-binding protein n=1 Tax=Priestia endophytica TaxID=135735 RepID=UPI002282EFCB|nr:(Fe-S)-binding protein [Priestia endophytica]MCY8233351.1 (Fe-S)-binding protein [Priestia endophytica]
MNRTIEQLRQELHYDKTNKCVQCGYCLPVCPTYMSMGKETHSPRGRINLVKMVGEGKIKDLSVLEEPLNLCLGCRACETACPTGVEYGSILEAARAALVKRKTFSSPVRLVRNTMFKKVFPSKYMMGLTGNSYWLYEKTGLQKVMRKSNLLKKLPFHLGEFETIMPKAISPKQRSHFSSFVKAKGERKYTVAFFTGCIMDAMFRKINELSIQLLAEVGCDVYIVEKQTCCGALHAHSGEMDDAKELAKKNIAAFEEIKADYIVNNSGGCGAMLYEYGHLLKAEPEWSEKAEDFSSKSKDISQILVLCGGLRNSPPRNDERVTYQRSCHMTNVQKVTNEPVELIKSIPGVEFVEMKDADMCCGSAGIYNIVNYDESMEILNEKMKHMKETKASVIITTNPGCLIQMKIGIERENLSSSVKVLHLIEYLADATGIS